MVARPKLLAGGRSGPGRSFEIALEMLEGRCREALDLGRLVPTPEPDRVFAVSGGGERRRARRVERAALEFK